MNYGVDLARYTCWKMIKKRISSESCVTVYYKGKMNAFFSIRNIIVPIRNHFLFIRIIGKEINSIPIRIIIQNEAEHFGFDFQSHPGYFNICGRIVSQCKANARYAIFMKLF